MFAPKSWLPLWFPRVRNSRGPPDQPDRLTLPAKGGKAEIKIDLTLVL